jgi:gamma-tubulin complex component 3
MGVMYRKVTAFTKDQEKRKGMTEQVSLFPFIGVITDSQSLCHFLHHELSEYHRLLAVLESQMSLTAPNTEETSHTPAESSGLTLLRLGLWTEEMRLKMKMMVQVVEDVKGKSNHQVEDILLMNSELWWSASIQGPRSYESW